MTKNNCARIKCVLLLCYFNNKGLFRESNLEESLVPKYVNKISVADVGIEGFPVSNKITHSKIPDNTGVARQL